MKTYRLMLILFDQGTPWPLRRYLTGHTIHSAYWLGWNELPDGELLERADEEGYELLITTDHSLRHQQNLVGRTLAILVLMPNDWSIIQLRTSEIRDAVNQIEPGVYLEIGMPPIRRR